MLLLAAMLPSAAPAQEVPELQITSTNYILIDADTGEIFAQRGAHEHRAPASLTKVFTAIESIEEASPDVTITTSEADLVSEWASQVGFDPGENFSVKDLLYGMMLPSGNDAARALARSLGAEPGDTDEQATNRFLDHLNTRIQDMGLNDTQLLNPDGWGIPGHYSSAYDLAAFTMYALHYPRFVNAFSTVEYETADGAYTFENNNRMLRTYDGIIGGKTGYDEDAGWCLINVAQRNGHRLIAVTLNGVAPDDWYDDNRVLLDYGFEQLAQRAARGGGITGEFARYRDPDAAVILAMASASGAIGAPLAAEPAPLQAPAPHTSQSALVGTGSPADVTPAQPGLTRDAPPPMGASDAGLLVAAAVAAFLTALRVVSTWRLLPSRKPAAALGDATLAMPFAPSPELLAEGMATASD